jgi:phosphatidylglycerol:prolipoprotein diacylglycerol transferase
MNALLAIPFPSIDPVFLRLGPIALHWYGIAYAVGFFLAFLFLRRMTRRGQLKLTDKQVADLVSWLALGVIVGGRLGWWLVYHRAVGNERWYEPLAIWHGGMSFHGGLVGVLITLRLWTWRQHASLLNVADALARTVPIGLFFGRIANFINAELVGRPTSAPWGVIFPGDHIPRHPSQLYEAFLEGLVMLAILNLVIPRFRLRDGSMAGWFLVLYGAMRFVVEFSREPDAELGYIALGWMTMGQLLSLAMLLAGMTMLLALHRSPVPRAEGAIR